MIDDEPLARPFLCQQASQQAAAEAARLRSQEEIAQSLLAAAEERRRREESLHGTVHAAQARGGNLVSLPHSPCWLHLLKQR